jgi:hypothetical protein
MHADGSLNPGFGSRESPHESDRASIHPEQIERVFALGR